MTDKGELEAARRFGNQSELAKTLQVESGGLVPQLKRRERAQLLGQLRERVLWGVTKQALDSKAVHPAFVQALDSGRCERLLVRSDVITLAMSYVLQATAHHIPYTFVQSPEFTGDVTVVLVSDCPIEESHDPIIN
ncbi:MAG: hypothetical protein FD169_2167 [Bacillota bacterium]|nr:MAG: hypothetical protein FD169_2167 [Bacillota bacterium]MBS3950137.1 DUF1694 domain-containing protein [Peptococcaceae bacterium]